MGEVCVAVRRVWESEEGDESSIIAMALINTAIISSILVILYIDRSDRHSILLYVVFNVIRLLLCRAFATLRVAAYSN